MIKYILLTLLVVLIAMVILYRYFLIIRVEGDSMHPTLKDKQIEVAFKHKAQSELIVGAIYIYFNPQGQPVIKRLKHYDSEKGQCYFLGDNSDCSIDSRHYGFVSEEYIIARLIRQYRRK